MFMGRKRLVQKTREVLNVGYQTSRGQTIYGSREFFRLRLLRGKMHKGLQCFRKQANFGTRPAADTVWVLGGLGLIVCKVSFRIVVDRWVAYVLTMGLAVLSHSWHSVVALRWQPCKSAGEELSYGDTSNPPQTFQAMLLQHSSFAGEQRPANGATVDHRPFLQRRDFASDSSSCPLEVGRFQPETYTKTKPEPNLLHVAMLGRHTAGLRH